MARLLSITKTVLRFLLVWGIDALSLLVTAAIFPGISFVEPDPLLILRDTFAAAFLLSIVNLMIRPIVLLLARPLGFIAVFILGFPGQRTGAAPHFPTFTRVSGLGLAGRDRWAYLCGDQRRLDRHIGSERRGFLLSGADQRLARRQSATTLTPGSAGGHA